MKGNVPSIDKPVRKKVGKGEGLVSLQLPKIPVYQNVDQYLISKAETERVRKSPQWDIPRTTPAMELVRARRDFYDSDTRLEKARKEYIKRRIELDALWEELRAKEDQLRENFIKFSPFTRENYDKRERANQKIKDELATQEQKIATIEEMTKRVTVLGQIKEEMEMRVGSFKFFEDYLITVLDTTTEFKDIISMLNRYETLAEARAKLGERQTRDLEILEESRAEMIHTTEKKIYSIIGFNTKIAELENRFERAKTYAVDCETQMAHAKNICHAKKVNMKLVEDSCRNLYNAICTRKGIEPIIHADDIENQLMYIKQTLVDLKKIIKMAKKRADKELQTTIPATNLPRISIAE